MRIVDQIRHSFMFQSYPPEEGKKLVGHPDEDYQHVKACVEQINEESQQSGAERRGVSVVSTHVIFKHPQKLLRRGILLF